MTSRVKASIHLFYGIIIGILATLCMGSLKTDMAEFKEEEIVLLGPLHFVKKSIDTYKRAGWTIIDIEIGAESNVIFYAHLGR